MKILTLFGRLLIPALAGLAAATPAAAQMVSDGNVELPFGAFVPGIDVFNKDQVAQLYFQSYYWPGRFVNGAYTVAPRQFVIPTNWTGNTAGCVAGNINPAVRQAAVRQVNFFRSIAGLSSAKVAGDSEHTKAQAAALIIGARGGVLDHFPPSNAPCYSADGATGAFSTNQTFIFGFTAQPMYLGGYMDDGGDNNFSVGHRRWILYPSQKAFAYASTDFVHPLAPNTLSGASTLWITDIGAARFDNPGFVAWPSPGYFPSLLLPSGSNRWSFSCAGCDFSSASVDMTMNGTAMPAPAIEPLVGNANVNGAVEGDATIVFKPVGVDYSVNNGLPVPLAQESAYTVNVRNVGVPGASSPQSYSYTVKVFDAEAYAATRKFSKYNVSDMWYAGAAQAGWGVMLQLAADGRLAAAWHTFDAGGNPIWAVMPTGHWSANNTVTGAVYTTQGSSFASAYAAADSAYTNEGVATFTFTDANTVTMQATLRGLTQSQILGRYVANAGDTAYVDGGNYNGLWQVAGEPGWAVAVHHRYQTIDAVLYVHDTNKTPTWYSLPSCTVDTVAAACSGSLYSSHASASPLVGGFTSSSVTQTPVGTVSFTFLDDNTATLSYTVNGVRVTKTIARNVFGGILGRKLSPAQAGEIDVDGTGKAQILVRSADARLMLGRLVNGQFQFSTTQDPGAKFRVVGVTDIDGDGKSDLVFQDTTQGVFGDVRAWSAFNPATDRLLRQVKLDWHVEGTGDLDGDGFGDLLWRWRGDDGIPNDTGVSYAWFTNGAGVDQVKKRGGAPLSWQLLGATDINGDGAADMLYLSPDGQLRALLDTGAGGRSCANVVIGSVPAGYAAIKYADFTGASRGDVLVKNAAGQVQLLSIDASAVHPPAIMTDMNSSCVSSSTPVTLTALPIGSVDPTWTFYAAGDYNGDGIRDIVWQQPNGTLTVWLLASNGQAPIVISNAGTAPAGFSVFQP